MDLWCIWKERNGRIFKDRRHNVDYIWMTLHENLLSSIRSSQWDDEDKIIPREEIHVAANRGIDKSHMDGLRCRENICKLASPSLWSPPLARVFKLNFDGASRGNSGPPGYGGVCRYANGKVLAIYLGAIGSDTNNSTKLEGLIQGFE